MSLFFLWKIEVSSFSIYMAIRPVCFQCNRNSNEALYKYMREKHQLNRRVSYEISLLKLRHFHDPMILILLEFSQNTHSIKLIIQSFLFLCYIFFILWILTGFPHDFNYIFFKSMYILKKLRIDSNFFNMKKTIYEFVFFNEMSEWLDFFFTIAVEIFITQMLHKKLRNSSRLSSWKKITLLNNCTEEKIY